MSSEPSWSVPLPRRPDNLPTLADFAMKAETLPDPNHLAHLTWVWVSRFLGARSGHRTTAKGALHLVRAMAALHYVDDDRVVHLPIATALPAPPDGVRGMQAAKLNPRDLDDAWQAAVIRAGIHATLDVKDAAVLVPKAYWPVLARFIADGPQATFDRLERALHAEAQRRIDRPDRRRSSEQDPRIAESTLETWQGMVRSLFTTLIELRARRYPSPWLADWPDALPPPVKISTLRADKFKADRTAPDIRQVRRALQAMDEDVTRRMSTKKGRARAFVALRDRAFRGLACATGARLQALWRLHASDIEFDHLFRATDERGPAVRLVPGKGLGNEERWKALHPVPARWLHEYMEYANIAPATNSALWITRHGNRQGLKERGDARIAIDSLANRISGSSSLVKAWLPIPGERNGLGELNEFVGYSPHSLRHLAHQWLQEAGSDYLSEHPHERQFITPEVIAAAALDHTQRSDRLGYKDLSDPLQRERLARIGLLGLGEYLWGDRGARHVPDALRIEAALRSIAESDARLATATDAREALRQRQRDLLLLDRPDDEIAALTAQERDEILLRSQRMLISLEDLNEEIQAALAQHGEACLELERARTALIPLDDFADEPDALAGDSPLPERPDPVQCRDRATVAEAAEAFGVSRSTMGRWFRGLMPYPAGDPRNPWDPPEGTGPPPCIHVLGPRSRWLILDALDPARIPPGVLAALRA